MTEWNARLADERKAGVRRSRAAWCLIAVLAIVAACTGPMEDDVAGTGSALSPSAIANIVIGSAALSVAEGECSPVVKLNRVDDSGTLVTTSSYMTIELSGPGYTFYADSGCTNEITTSFLNEGTHTNDIYFTNNMPGAQPLAVGASAHDGDAQLQVVTGSTEPIAQFTFETASHTVDIGACSPIVKFQRRDMEGALEVTPSYLEVQLSGAGFTFYSDSGCTTQITTSFLNEGTHTNGFYFTHSNAGTQTLTVDAADHQPGSQLHTIESTGGAPAVGPGAAYSLAEVPNPPNPPASPATSTTVTVTTTGELETRAGTAGSHIIVETDLSAANPAITASDVDLEVRPGGRVGRISIAAGVSRIRIRGGGIVQELTMARSSTPATDVDIDGVHFISPYYWEWGGNAMDLRGHRIRVTNCITDAGRYSIWADSDSFGQGTDVLIAANDFFSHRTDLTKPPESTVRLVGYERTAVLNNRLENGTKHNYRIHGNSDWYYAANNVLVRTGTMMGRMPGDELDDGMFRNNFIHYIENGLANLEPSVMTNFTLTGNQVYTDTGMELGYDDPVPSTWVVDHPPALPFECPVPRHASAESPGLVCAP